MRVCRTTKTIEGCGINKPLTSFYKTKGRYTHNCKDCRNKDKREKYKRNKIIKNIASMAWS